MAKCRWEITDSSKGGVTLKANGGELTEREMVEIATSLLVLARSKRERAKALRLYSREAKNG